MSPILRRHPVPAGTAVEPVDVRVRLSALWASVMFCFVYADYFNLYTPGKLAKVAAGDLGLGEPSDAMLVVVAVMMAVPSVMISLSLVLRPTVNRRANLTLAIAYAVIVALTTPGAEPFYLFFAALEIGLTVVIAATAWSWPAPDRRSLRLGGVHDDGAG